MAVNTIDKLQFLSFISHRRHDDIETMNKGTARTEYYYSLQCIYSTTVLETGLKLYLRIYTNRDN